MNIVLIGPQGSGKGTQADLVGPEFGLVKLSTGDLFRAAIAAGTELGQYVKGLLDRGELVPDETTLAVVEARLDEIYASGARGVLFDGFPRTRGQAEGLDKILADRGQELDLVIDLEVPEEVLVDRLAGRRVCTNCGAAFHVEFNPPETLGVCDRCGGTLIQRSDDKPEAIRRRLGIFYELTEPLLSYYGGKNLVTTIDGNRDVESVSEDIRTAITRASSTAKA